jgi:hypothetical protein
MNAAAQALVRLVSDLERPESPTTTPPVILTPYRRVER